MDDETKAQIAAIMAKEPAVHDWVMPADAPTFQEVASRDEVLAYRLGQAARAVWPFLRDKHSDKKLRTQLEPPEAWLLTEMRILRQVLDGAQVADMDVREYVLRFLGLSQSWKKSDYNAQAPARVSPAVTVPVLQR